MSDDFPDGRDGSPATTSFEEWLDRHAESQGVSRQELFERLVSSYWTLNEMVRLLGDSGSGTSFADIPPGNDGDGSAPTISGGGADADEDAGRSRRRDQSDPSTPERGGRGRRDGGDPDRIAELRDRVEDLESRLDGERERGQSQDKALEAIADRLAGVEADLEEVARESESARESLSAEYESMADRLDGIESEINGRHKQLANGQERLRSRVDAEFDDLETILEYLVDRTDDLDAKLAAVEQRHDDELTRLRWEREALQSVMANAAERDAHAGECEVCGERVDLDLLAEPYCAACGSLLTGVEERSKWLLFSDVVVTAEEEPSGGESRSDPVGESGDSTRTTRVRADPGPDSLGRGDESNSEQPATGGRAAAVDAGPTQSAEREPGAETFEARPDRRGSDGSDGGQADADTADARGSDGTADDSSAGPDPADSGFSFGDLPSDAGAEDGAETAPDAPFGDLEDLEREERRAGEE